MSVSRQCIIIYMNENFVICPLCFKQFKSLQSHIRTHKITLDTFKELYPDAVLVSDIVRQRTSKTSKASGCGSWRKGAKLTDKQRMRLSERMSGSNNPFYGRQHTDKTRQKMSDNHADVSGDKNPFRQAMKDPDFRIQLAN